MRRPLAVVIAAAALALSASSSAGAATYTNFRPLIFDPFATSDHGPLLPFPSTIDVNDAPGTVTKVRATLIGVSHQTTRELAALLQGPNGQTVLLLDDGCGGQDTRPTPLTFTFDDAAATQVPFEAPCATGTFKPGLLGAAGATFGPAGPAPPYANSMSAFAGGGGSGLWQLYAYDVGLGVSGQIAGGWALELTTAGKAAKRCKKAKKRVRAAKKKRCKKKNRG